MNTCHLSQAPCCIYLYSISHALQYIINSLSTIVQLGKCSMTLYWCIVPCYIDIQACITRISCMCRLMFHRTMLKAIVPCHSCSNGFCLTH